MIFIKAQNYYLPIDNQWGKVKFQLI